MEEGKSAFKILTGKHIGKRALGRLWRRLKDNIGMERKQTGVNTANCIDSVQNRDYWRALVNALSNFRVS